MERRLAAVMIADVVGYGRLSQADEEGTRSRFQADLTEVFQPRVARHHGRIVKTMGDALLVEFQSVVDALRCAVEIQQIQETRNASLPSQRRMVFRIGINLGDVIVEGDDIHGDGVNIAHRMQLLAEPNGIAISGTTYDHVKAKLPVGYASLGQQRVKSIDEPVRVYRVILDPAAAGKTLEPAMASMKARGRLVVFAVGVTTATVASLLGFYFWLMSGTGELTQSPEPSNKPSLVVLPFDNLSDDKEQSYLADGITEDLTTELARVPGLFVISRNAAFAYKGKATLPKQIATELGVRYVLEGSVRRAGNELRINAQLIEASTNGHLWAEKFDGQWADVFDLQDRIVDRIASALELRLIQGHSIASSAGGTANVAAYDALLLGYDAARQGAPKDIAAAAHHYEQALELDPNFGRAAAELAWLYWAASGNRAWLSALGVSDETASDRINEFLQRAAVNPSATYYQLVADRLIHDQRSGEAVAMMEKAISLDSSDPVSYEVMSHALTYNGRPTEGLGFIDAAKRIDPGWTAFRHYLAGLAHFSMGRFEDALASLGTVDPKMIDGWTSLRASILQEAIYGALDRHDEARQLDENLKPLLADLYLEEVSGLLARTLLPFKDDAVMRSLLDGLRKAGAPELPFGYDPNSPDRLTGPETKTLLFGHELRGTQLSSHKSYWRATTADGETSVKLGSVQDTGTLRIEDDTACIFYSRWGRNCFVYFRNPNGSPQSENDFIGFHPWDRFEFTMVK